MNFNWTFNWEIWREDAARLRELASVMEYCAGNITCYGERKGRDDIPRLVSSLARLIKVVDNDGFREDVSKLAEAYPEYWERATEVDDMYEDEDDEEEDDEWL